MMYYLMEKVCDIKMDTTIILSTYNGEQYLAALLNSLNDQSYKPTEVLIFDDCSTDNTVDIITKFISSNRLNSWKLSTNDRNLGWQDNFWQGIKKAKGDLIFPCDQDDIWEKDKLKHMVRAMQENQDIDLLASDYQILYMSCSSKFPDARLSKIKNDGRIDRLNCDKSLLVVDRPGCTYCIRRSLITTMEKIRFDKCPHDALAWRAAWLNDGLAILHKVTITFRRHGLNSSDEKRRSLDERIFLTKYYIRMLKKILESEMCNEKKKKYATNCLTLQSKRLCALERRDIFRFVCLITRINYFPSIRTYIGDFIALIKETSR